MNNCKKTNVYNYKRNILFKICYNGFAYSGFAHQINAISISDIVSDGLKKILNHNISIIGCSRTDKGVHAIEYFFNVYSSSTISLNALKIALNRRLPNDIYVIDCIEVDLNFHARYNARYKQYIYKLLNSKERNPFLNELVLHYPFDIDIPRILESGRNLIGTHNFIAFSNSNSIVKNTIRSVTHFGVCKDNYNVVTISITGTGFLNNMVRIIVGTLLNISEKKLSPDRICFILESKDRKNAGKTISANGLYLSRIFY